MVLDDDRALTVSNVTVNEGSPYVVFTVSGSNNQQTRLSLANQNNDSSDLSSLQYFNGTWQNYTANQVVSLDGSGSLLVRVALSPEQEAALDGPETFNLVATNTGGTASTGGLGTIVDDGTGSYFAETNNSATSNVPNGVVLDDDRALTVSNVTVNEGSALAVFTVTGKEGQLVKLSLSSGTATIENGNGTVLSDGSEDFGPALQYWNGSAWTNYTANSFIEIPSDGDGSAAETAKLLVRTAIHADALAEGDHTFTLTATNTGLSSSTGTATIDDSGGGVRFTDVAPTGPATTDPAPVTVSTNLDDDRPITVTGGDYNENSPRAVFTVNANPNQLLTLDVQNAAESGKAPTGDNEGKPNDSLDTAPIYFSLDGGATWHLYIGPITAGNLPVLVAVDITNERDDAYEGEEQLKLVVTSGGQTVSGYSSIFDDGTGTVTRNITEQTTHVNGTNDPIGIKDDDTPKSGPSVLPSPAPSTPALPTVITVTPVPAAPAQSFASALTPLAYALAPIDPPWSLVDSITSASGFQIPVSDTAAPGLSLYRGVTDQFVQTTGVSSKISLPADAFIHSNKDAVIKLEAKQADNSNLPSWVKFDQTSGVFEVTPPFGFKGKIDLKVLARDDDGREAVAMFQLFIGEQTTDRPQSRESFTEKLRMAGKRPITLVRVSDVMPSEPAAPARIVAAKVPAA